MNHNKFRIKILNQAFKKKKFLETNSSYYKKAIKDTLGPNPNGQKIFELGSSLSEIFKSSPQKRTDSNSRTTTNSQSTVANAGNAWETLLIWYLNFILWNTPLLASSGNKSFTPEVVRDAISVTISNNTTSKEADIFVYSVPTELTNNPTIEEINKSIKSNIKNSDLTVIQAKTNWNENAQIPMLWDIIYKAYDGSIENVQVGINGLSPKSFNQFSYAFVTVPTGRKDPNSKSVSVSRVSNLSGGNYWGKKTKSGVAMSFNEFFGRNFGKYFSDYGSISDHVDKMIKNDTETLKMFLNFDF